KKRASQSDGASSEKRNPRHCSHLSNTASLIATNKSVANRNRRPAKMGCYFGGVRPHTTRLLKKILS
ncbi:MAG: hypothetical protein AB8B69_24540, partial [Chitinophagales bacterium]